MASTNQSPFYQKAEAKFLSAQTDEDKLKFLEEMIRECPKHKSSEKMLANLKTRRIKLKQKIEKERKVKKSSSGKGGIKKEDLQAVIIGPSGSGKSWLLSKLTNANPKIKNNIFEEFTTKKPEIGIMDYNDVGIQLIENPAIESEYYDKGLTYTADVVIAMVTSYEQIKDILPFVKNKKTILCYLNLIDKLPEQKRKIEARLKSERYNYLIIEPEKPETLEKLKEKIFQSFNKIRIYTKQPEEKQKSEKPIILNPGSDVKDVAEKILKGFSNKIKQTKIWGPSSKYPGQVVGLKHEVKDMDVVEFKTR